MEGEKEDQGELVGLAQYSLWRRLLVGPASGGECGELFTSTPKPCPFHEAGTAGSHSVSVLPFQRPLGDDCSFAHWTGGESATRPPQ